MPLRLLNRSIQVALDLTILSLAFWLAFLFRFEFEIPKFWLRVLLLTWPYAVLAHYVGLLVFGVPRMSWRYVNMYDVGRILAAMASSFFVLVAARLIGPHIIHHFDIVLMPLGVLTMDCAIGFLGLVGVRTLRRLRGEQHDRKRREAGQERHRVLLIGAGQVGVAVAREIANRPDLGLNPVGFLDDDPVKVGTTIGGLPVLGLTKDVSAISERKRVRRALITLASAPGGHIRRITELCRNAELDTKIIPSLYEIVGSKVNLSRIREVAIEDLLGREPVQLDEAVVSASIRSRVVLVTGAGGSIGSELCRQICRFGPARLVLAERFENALFEIHRELVTSFPHIAIEPRVADVCDGKRMEQIFDSTMPKIVFHAAAHKHVPMMEWNPGEAVKNNVGGTRAVAELAHRYGVERFVLVSTDKAVNPTSVMGATKRVAELFLQVLAAQSSTRFVTVRFGNVLGSAGSVVPIFREQIAKGGPITITHPDMQRYFMTIPEATQLVLQAGAMGEGGEIFILDMGQPVRIVDLARDLISLSGLRPGEDVDIVFSGVRPGEKLFEELSTAIEQADRTKHPKIYIGRAKAPAYEGLLRDIGALVTQAHDGEPDLLRQSLAELVPEYQTGRSERGRTTGSEVAHVEAIETSN
jgi:FlaA1/EpsC-like NDP-sugar epimerase